MSVGLLPLVVLAEANLATAAHGGVLQFDGDGSYVDIGDSFEPNSAFTIETWVNLREPPALEKNGDITTKYNHSSLYVYHDSGGIQVGFGVWDGSTWKSADSDLTFPLGVWRHVAGVYDGSSTIKLYVDGELNATQSATLGFIDYSHPRLIGGYFYPDGTPNFRDFFPGLIDEVRFWNTARTQTEIQASMNEQLTGSESGLVAYYTFDERIGNKVVDLAGGDHNGAMEGNVTRLNLLGSSLTFDNGPYVQIPDAANQDISGPMAIAAWVYNTNVLSSTNPFLYREHGYYLEKNDHDGRVNFYRKNENHDEPIIASTTQLQSHRWHHVAAVYDGSSEGRIYIDGKLDASGPMNGALYESDNPIKLGKNSSNNKHEGHLSEVSLWNRVLSQAEIRKIMHGALVGDESGLVSYWPLNEGEGSKAHDFSDTGGNHGTISSAEWKTTAPDINGSRITTHRNFPVYQKLYFPGATDYSEVSDSANVIELNSTTGLFKYTPSDTTPHSFTLEATDGPNTDTISLASQVLDLASLVSVDHGGVYDFGGIPQGGSASYTMTISVSPLAGTLQPGTITSTGTSPSWEYSTTCNMPTGSACGVTATFSPTTDDDKGYHYLNVYVPTNDPFEGNITLQFKANVFGTTKPASLSALSSAIDTASDWDVIDLSDLHGTIDMGAQKSINKNLTITNDHPDEINISGGGTHRIFSVSTGKRFALKT